MKKYTVKIIYTLICCLLFTSCSLTKGNDENNDDIILQPENSNVINLAIDGSDTLNPILTKSAAVTDAMNLIFQPLFSLDQTLTPIAVLAESYEKSNDSLTYTIRIKDNILWHDGSALTSSDVLHTINLIRFNDSVYTSSLSCISGVSVSDRLTVSIKLNRPVPNFCALLSFPIIQNNSSTEPGANYTPIGTGPFKYIEKTSSDKIKLSANEYYNGAKPGVSEIYLNTLKDTEDIITAFNASEVDTITSSVMNFSTYNIRGEVYSADYISNNMAFLGFNTSSSIFSSANTRNAVSYLIDRQEIVTNDIFSRAEASRIPINPSAWYCPKLADTKYDNDYISEMLALDNWTPGENGQYTRTKYTSDSEDSESTDERLTMDILINEDNDERKRIASRIADKLNGFGIETTVTPVSFDEYKERINNKNYSMFIGEIQLPVNMDCTSLLAAPNNFISYSSGDMNNAILHLGTASSADEQTQAFSEYANLFLEQTPFVPLFFRKETVYYEKNISGINPPTISTAYPNPENWYISAVRQVTENITE